MASRISIFFIVSILSLSSAAPFFNRIRRSVEEVPEAQNTADLEANIREAISFSTAANLAQSEQNEDSEGRVSRFRKNKSLHYFDYLPSEIFASDEDYGEDEFTIERSENNDEDDISRTIPSKRRPSNPYKDFSNTNSIGYENSPIYYIRLPPTPYMFVPGLGYVSQPPSIGPPVAPPVNPFINLPIDFVSNGKPTNVYQWSGAPSYQPSNPISSYNPIFDRPSRPQTSLSNNYNYQKPQTVKKPLTDSKITNLNKGQYLFNGKPNNIFVLRDTYNSLYSDALQNFYP